jgi:hypothetical protein
MGGTLCIGAPITRAATLFSSGTSGCGGTFAFDFNAWLAGGFDPSIAAGEVLCAQYWFRDPQSPSGGAGLSDAVRFVVYI